MTSHQRSKLKNFFASCISKRRFFEYKIDIIFSFWPLRGRLQWPLISHQRSKLKIHFFASCISKHRFFGLRNSKMTLFFHFDLSEVVYNDLWPLIRGQNSKYNFLHHEYQNIGFLGWGIQKWHYFFILTSRRSSTMTSDLSLEVKTQNTLFCKMQIKT